MAAIYVELNTILHAGVSLIPESNDLMSLDEEKKQQIQHLASMKRHGKIECITKYVGCGWTGHFEILPFTFNFPSD